MKGRAQATAQQQQPQPKHIKYHELYRPNDIFWGLGIEHETYLETSQHKLIRVADLSNCTARERYSIDYLTAYRPGIYQRAIRHLESVLGTESTLRIPVLMNSHSFQNADIYGEHRTLYSSMHGLPNPAFNSKTTLQALQDAAPTIFKDKYDRNFVFDGDTIEFMTLNFYNATVRDVLDELAREEAAFVDALNKFAGEADPAAAIHKYHPYAIARCNYGFASYMTNLRNIAMFNNGTLHINITLPTELGPDAMIKDFEAFTEKHRRLARALQWFEPFIIAKYCSPDPLYSVPGLGASGGSQRLAVSRYIGVGTYNTEEMPRGKILMRPRDSDNYAPPAYNALDNIGMDINFNKHYNHGIEFRILDAVTSWSELETLLSECIMIANFSQETVLPDPRKCPLWHSIVCGVMRDGAKYTLSQNELERIESVCGVAVDADADADAGQIYMTIMRAFSEKYRDGGVMSATLAPRAAPAPAVAPAPAATVVKTGCWRCIPK